MRKDNWSTRRKLVLEYDQMTLDDINQTLASAHIRNGAMLFALTTNTIESRTNHKLL
jgi:hypothetical protein